MITHSLGEVCRGGGTTEVTSPVLPLSDGVEDGAVDPFGFVIQVQMPQHHDRAQKQGSRVRQVLNIKKMRMTQKADQSNKYAFGYGAGP